MTLVVFPSKAVGETSQYLFNFSDKLLFGESVTGASVSLSVSSGIDPTPSAMIAGAPTLSLTGVSQDITGGVVGVIYNISCTVTASGSHNYVKAGVLAVLADAGNYESPAV